MRVPSKSRPAWKLRDLVDLEAALQSDGEISRDEIEARDREWGGQIAADSSGLPGDRAERIFLWLDAFRRHDGTGLPGKDVERALHLFGRVSGGLGLVLGALTAVSVLRYEGDAPVNVTGFFFVLILLQILLAVVSVVGLLRWKQVGTGWIGDALRSGWRGLAERLGRWRRDGPENAGLGEGAAFGAFFGNHGDLVGYRVGRIGQVFGIGFNLGAILAMLLVLLVADRAFGWQSTLIQSPETFHRLVQTVALPWRDWVPMAAPGLAAVEGSRIVLKDGAAALETPDLTAWWPFLLMAVIVYGLFPRVVFWGVFSGLESRALGRRRFDGLRYEDLDDRIVTGSRDAGTDPSGDGDEDWLDREAQAEAGEVYNPASAPLPVAERPGYLLVDDGEGVNFPPGVLMEAVATACGGRVEATVPMAAVAGDRPAVKRLALLVESWTAPVEEDLMRIRDLRGAVGPDVILRVLLLPVPGEVAPEGRWVEIWSRFLDRLRDPNLSVRSLVMEPEVSP